MNRLARLLLALLAVAAARSGVAQTTVLDRLRESTVHVGQQLSPEAAPQWSGTGFFVDALCTIATAKHVLNPPAPAVFDKERIVVRYRNPRDPTRLRTPPARVLYESPTTDLAFVRIEDPRFGVPCRSEVRP